MVEDPDDIVLEHPKPGRVKRPAILDNQEKKRYEAFDTKGKVFPYLEIRCITKPSQAPQSKYFMNAIYSIDFDNLFILLYSFMAVEIKGRNLKSVRRAIQNGHCEFIQEFHDKEYLKPLHNEPMITSIGFITGDKLSGLLCAYSEEKQE